jgi:hypothetical protein
MKISAACVLLATAIYLAAGSPAPADDATYPSGSKIGLIPPGGFVASARFRGFEDQTNNAAILMLEMPSQAYREVDKAMTADALKKQGVTMEKREPITLPSGKALLVVGRQQADGTKLRKWILVASTPDLTALVTALVPDAAKTVYTDAAVRKALTSLVIRSSVPIEEQISLLPFRLDELAGLRAFRVEPNTVFLTDGPKDTLEASEQSLLVVSAAIGGPSETQQRDNFARNLLAGLPGFKNVRVQGTDIIRLAGQQTHQILAEAKDVKTDADVKLVQWLRFGNGAFVRVLGIARADAWAAAFPRFRSVRDGVGARQ